MWETIFINIISTISPSDSLGDAVNSAFIVIAVIVPLIIAGLAFIKAKSQDVRIREALETGISVGRLATMTANKSLEDKQNIKNLVDLALRVTSSDDTKQDFAEKLAFIEKLNKEIQATEAQIKRLLPYIPGQANVDTIVDLPREKDF